MKNFVTMHILLMRLLIAEFAPPAADVKNATAFEGNSRKN